MCRYAGKKYKVHFVCFACRKQFKRPALEEVLSQHGVFETYRRLLSADYDPTRRTRAERATGTTLEAIERDYRATVSSCPQCCGEMADLGRDFRPPRMSAVRAWERLHAMYKIGRAWHTCGCNGPGYIPTGKTDYRAYLRDRLAAFSGMMNSAQTSSTVDVKDRRNQVQHWASLVRKVRAELEAAGHRTTRRRLGAA